MKTIAVFVLLACSSVFAGSTTAQSKPATSQPSVDELRALAPGVYADIEKLCRGKDGLPKDVLDKLSGNLFKGLVFRTQALVSTSGDKNHLSHGWVHYVDWDFGKIVIEWIIQNNNSKPSEAEARKYVEMPKTHDFFITWKVVEIGGMSHSEDWYGPNHKRYAFSKGLSCPGVEGDCCNSSQQTLIPGALAEVCYGPQLPKHCGIGESAVSCCRVEHKHR